MARAIATEQPATARRALRPAIPWAWLYLVPTLVFFLGWQLYPIFRVAWISFTDYHFLRTGVPVHWVWFQNYITAFHDPLVRTGLLRAAGFTALFLPGMIFLPMFIAVMIDRITQPKVAAFYRIVLLIPSMIPGPLIFVLWTWMYNLYIGPINYFLVNVFHIYNVYNQPQWLGDPKLVFLAIAVMEWWWGLGYHAMFYLAGLATIPKELHEAARLDGANEWHLFWNITFPRLLPIILVLVVLRFGTAYAVIDEYLIMGGGLDRTRPTYTWTVYMWDEAFQIGDHFMGYAAAIGWIGTIIMLVVTVCLFYLFRPRD